MAFCVGALPDILRVALEVFNLAKALGTWSFWSHLSQPSLLMGILRVALEVFNLAIAHT